MERRLVMVGVSAGGLKALCTLTGELGPDFQMSMVIVQHRSKDSEALCEILQQCTPLPVREALDKEPLRPAEIYIAPPDYHLLVEPGYLSLSVDEPVRYSRPSIDVAFESAADAYGAAAVGVVLTGANADGAAGLRRIADGGGFAIVQDPRDAEVAAMPRFALRQVPEARVLPLSGIAALLRELQGAGAAAEEE